MSSDPQVEMVRALLDEYPELVDLYHEHINDYDEILPHVFVADVKRWAVRRHVEASREGRDDPQLDKLLRQLGEIFRKGDPDQQELIAVSFLENLDAHAEWYGSFRDRLAPELVNELSRLNG